MKIAVISDIHGNLEAFRRVLADMENLTIDKVICLGDLIGYGPEPNEVIRQVQELHIPSTMGNHELGIVRPEYLDWFNASSRESLIITRDLLDEHSMDYLHTLPPLLVTEGALFVHGCPPDSITTYLFQLSDTDLENLFRKSEQCLSFVGHTHELAGVSFGRHGVRHFLPGEGRLRLDPELRYIINVGSVGQPRDGNNRAKYVIWDNAGNEIEVRFVAYDIAKTAQRILELGFPRINATRLW